MPGGGTADEGEPVLLGAEQTGREEEYEVSTVMMEEEGVPCTTNGIRTDLPRALPRPAKIVQQAEVGAMRKRHLDNSTGCHGRPNQLGFHR